MIVAVILGVGIGFVILFGMSFVFANPQQPFGLINPPPTATTAAAEFNTYPQTGFGPPTISDSNMMQSNVPMTAGLMPPTGPMTAGLMPPTGTMTAGLMPPTGPMTGTMALTPPDMTTMTPNSGMNMNSMMGMMMNMMMPGSMGSMANMPTASMNGGTSPFFIPLDKPHNNSSKPLTIDQAHSIAADFLLRLNNPNLGIGVTKEYSNNFYVTFREKNTGVYAFEVMIDKLTGAVYAEPGANLFWNTKYRFLEPNLATGTAFNQQRPFQQFMTPMGPTTGSSMSGMTPSSMQKTVQTGLLHDVALITDDTKKGPQGVNRTSTSPQNMSNITVGTPTTNASKMSSNLINSTNKTPNTVSNISAMQNMMVTGSLSSGQTSFPILGQIQIVNPLASTIIPIGPQQAQQLAQQFLDTYFKGLTAGNVTTFYGYYTIDILQNAAPHCILSVNGYTGQVWYKPWHMGFVKQIEG